MFATDRLSDLGSTTSVLGHAYVGPLKEIFGQWRNARRVDLHHRSLHQSSSNQYLLICAYRIESKGQIKNLINYICFGSNGCDNLQIVYTLANRYISVVSENNATKIDIILLSVRCLC
ncbi:MAG: hypothetical protein GFH27_549301n213 [Chloroflexi bacterium AL-W]|nr:hypothetical protein [Chloroflexi bacterium AL-N1]NOK68406.1 hypothetical protein [Chloroflexi bacterium AL-N10]NOK74052.1 hypothetical protein [Chloroflexi bacterium AL-N5]NOK83020.1 hypothetical protein [Chloroflexi bacterium AL-W]NOK90542.1 hypothetical protein [Chloroflexi bacterium AL-N15]